MMLLQFGELVIDDTEDSHIGNNGRTMGARHLE